MTIQTAITCDEADRIQIADLKMRSTALVQINAELRAIFLTSLQAMKGDIEARAETEAVIVGAINRLNASDDDLSSRLTAMLMHVDAFELGRIAFDALHRSYHVDIRIDTIETRRAATARAVARGADAYRSKQHVRKTAYTVAYEAASKLPASRRRQLAEAILES